MSLSVWPSDLACDSGCPESKKWCLRNNFDAKEVFLCVDPGTNSRIDLHDSLGRSRSCTEPVEKLLLPPGWVQRQVFRGKRLLFLSFFPQFRYLILFTGNKIRSGWLYRQPSWLERTRGINTKKTIFCQHFSPVYGPLRAQQHFRCSSHVFCVTSETCAFWRHDAKCSVATDNRLPLREQPADSLSVLNFSSQNAVYSSRICVKGGGKDEWRWRDRFYELWRWCVGRHFPTMKKFFNLSRAFWRRRKACVNVFSGRRNLCCLRHRTVLLIWGNSSRQSVWRIQKCTSTWPLHRCPLSCRLCRCSTQTQRQQRSQDPGVAEQPCRFP